MTNFFPANLSLVIALLLVNCNNQPRNISNASPAFIDTMKLLAGNKFKFWDIHKEGEYTYNHTGEHLNWMFTIDKNLVEYSYQNRKRIKHIYGEYILIGYFDFQIKKDTISIYGISKEKYLINKLVTDTLVVQHIGEYGLKPPILFIKSKDQVALPK